MAHRGPCLAVSQPRFFLPPDCFRNERLLFPDDVSQQIARVLRLRMGQRVIALDGQGIEYTVRLESIGRTVEGLIEAKHANQSEPAMALSLYVGVLKAAKLEMVVQKCTELGMSRFTPVISERSVPAEPSASRHSRFTSIAREAAEQSRRGRIPQIAPAAGYHEALHAACDTAPVVLLWEEERSLRLADLKLQRGTPAVGLFIGPEGGFTAGEAEAARRSGAHVASLGPRILRAETAAIAGTALLLAAQGEL